MDDVGVPYAATAPPDRGLSESTINVMTTNINPVNAAADDPTMT